LTWAIFKVKLRERQNCKKEHSNYQRKCFSESSESMDVSKSHAECNVPNFPGVRSRFSSVQL